MIFDDALSQDGPQLLRLEYVVPNPSTKDFVQGWTLAGTAHQLRSARAAVRAASLPCQPTEQQHLRAGSKLGHIQNVCVTRIGTRAYQPRSLEILNITRDVELHKQIEGCVERLQRMADKVAPHWQWAQSTDYYR